MQTPAGCSTLPPVRRLLVCLGLLVACSSADDPPAASGAAGSGGTESAGAAGVAGSADGGDGGSGSAAAPPEGGVPVAEWDQPVEPLSAEAAADKRAACEFQAGQVPKATLGAGVPVDGDFPIDHFVLVMLENRSFDHMLQRLPDVGVTDADVAPDDFTNTTLDGKVVGIHPVEHYCIEDTAHSWAAVHGQLDGGQMSGFVTTNQASGQDGARAMGYLTPDTAPFSYFLAKTFAISDRHFCSLPGPTWPNRNFYYAASAFGKTKNQFPENHYDPIHGQLLKRGIDWRIYKSDLPGAGAFLPLIVANKEKSKNIRFLAEDMAAGDVAPVTFVDPELTSGVAKTGAHPPANHEYGEQFLYDVVKAVSSSPVWKSTAIIITYDEHGGFYDHVPPPAACPPDDIAPEEGGELGGYDRLGPRVPLYVISPWAKHGHVSHVVTDHTSVLRLLELRFRIGAMSRRDANADPLLDMFDLEHEPDTTPPVLPPRPELTAAQEASCQTSF
jgi:phospholipase C